MKNQKGNALFSLLLSIVILGGLFVLIMNLGSKSFADRSSRVASIEKTTLDTVQKTIVVKVKNNGDQKLRNLNLSCDVTMKSGSHLHGTATLFEVLHPKSTGIFTAKNLNYLKFGGGDVATDIYEPIAFDDISTLTCRVVEFEPM